MTEGATPGDERREQATAQAGSPFVGSDPHPFQLSDRGSERSHRTTPDDVVAAVHEQERAPGLGEVVDVVRLARVDPDSGYAVHDLDEILRQRFAGFGPARVGFHDGRLVVHFVEDTDTR